MGPEHPVRQRREARAAAQQARARLDSVLWECQDAPGLAGVVTSRGGGVLDVYWKDQLPEHVSQVFAEVARHVQVHVRQATFDIVEMRAARDRLTTAGLWHQGVVTIALMPDGSGLEIGYDGPQPPVDAAREALGEMHAVWVPRERPVPARRAASSQEPPRPLVG